MSDPSAEEALYDIQSMRAFAGLAFGRDAIPDETTILNGLAESAADVIGESTLGDAILDRIVHNAYRLELDRPSIRKIKAAETALLAEHVSTPGRGQRSAYAQPITLG